MELEGAKRMVEVFFKQYHKTGINLNIDFDENYDVVEYSSPSIKYRLCKSTLYDGFNFYIFNKYSVEAESEMLCVQLYHIYYRATKLGELL